MTPPGDPFCFHSQDGHCRADASSQARALAVTAEWPIQLLALRSHGQTH